VSAPLPIARTVADLRAAIAAQRKLGRTIGLAPTMGALHEGHLSLVRAAKQRCGFVAATLFVNPKQFAPHEDFDRYPRDEAADAKLLAGAGCDLLYAPERSVMYPDGFATAVTVADVSAPLEGEFRPHFFSGVATVVTKLLLQALPDAAFFGEKDYQQLRVISQMAKDLDLPLKVVGVKTVREKDGLALSSRNAYLSPAERAVAPVLYRVLTQSAARIKKGEPVALVLEDGRGEITRAGFALDYLDARHALTLRPVASQQDGPIRLFVAAKIGKTRLIDNVAA
jgi:pantoate--beta-alanine ligase